MNSHLLPLFVSYRSSGEKLIKYQANSSCVIMSVILITTLLFKALILQGGIWSWSLLGFKGLRAGRHWIWQWLQSEIIITWHWPQSVSTYSCAKRREVEDHYTLLHWYSAYGTSWQSDVLTLQAPISTYKFSILIFIHFFKELVERVW